MLPVHAVKKRMPNGEEALGGCPLRGVLRWLRRGSGMAIYGAFFCMMLLISFFLLAQNVILTQKGWRVQAAVDAVADGTAVRVRQNRLGFAEAEDAAAEVMEVIASAERLEFETAELDAEAFDGGIVRFTGTVMQDRLVASAEYGMTPIALTRTAATSARRRRIAAGGGMDEYGAMQIPLIRQDVGLIDLETRTSEDPPYLNATECTYETVPRTTEVQRDGSVAVVDHTVARNGCGIVAMAMILTYYEGEVIWPSDVHTNRACRLNTVGEYQGAYTAELCADYGLDVTQLDGNSPSHQAPITDALMDGCPVLVLVQHGAPAGRNTPGHYFVLSGYDIDTGKYFIHDPGGYPLYTSVNLSYCSGGVLNPDMDYVEATECSGLYRPLWSWEEINEHAINYWIIGQGAV